MPTYIGLYRLTDQGITNVKDAPVRLKKAIEGAEAMGAKVIGAYAVMGEYDYARASLDSLMDAGGYSSGERDGFFDAIWEERFAGAQACEPFALPTLDGRTYEFDPMGAGVAVINFMSPT